jgi:hypothetical protein
VLGEPVELATGGPGDAQRLAQRGREVAHDPDLGPGRRRVPAAFSVICPERARFPRPGQLVRILGEGALGGRVFRLPDHVLDLVGADAGPRHHADRGAVGPPVDRDDGELA